MMLFRKTNAVQVIVKSLSDGKVQRITSKSHSHVQATLMKLERICSGRKIASAITCQRSTRKQPVKTPLAHTCEHMHAHVLTCMRQWSLDWLLTCRPLTCDCLLFSLQFLTIFAYFFTTLCCILYLCNVGCIYN